MPGHPGHRRPAQAGAGQQKIRNLPARGADAVGIARMRHWLMAPQSMSDTPALQLIAMARARSENQRSRHCALFSSLQRFRRSHPSPG